MASVPQLLLNSVLQQGTPAYRQLVRRGFREEWLREPELRNVWSIIHEHIARYRSIPSQTYIHERQPHFQFLDSAAIEGEHPLALADLLRTSYTQVQLDDMLEKGLQMNESDPHEAMAWMLEKMSRLRRMSSTVEILDMSSDVSCEEVEEEYERAASGDALSLALPWPSVEQEVMGLKPEELTLIYGRPKSMKSFIAFYMAVHAYFYSGARVLIVTREMSKEQCRKRIVALLAKVAYGPWRKGRLRQTEREHVFSLMRGLIGYERETYSAFQPGLHPCIRIVDGQHPGYGGMDLVQMLIDETEPDLVVDDSMYLAAHDNSNPSESMDWKVQSGIARSAKLLAKSNKIAYLATTQASKSSKNDKKDQKAVIKEVTNLDSLAFSDGFAQNCDLAIRSVFRENYILLGFPGYREGRLGILPIKAEPCVDFGEIDKGDLADYELDEKVASAIYENDTRVDQHVPAGPDRSPDEDEKEIPADLHEADSMTPRKRAVRRKKK